MQIRHFLARKKTEVRSFVGEAFIPHLSRFTVDLVAAFTSMVVFAHTHKTHSN